jgi:hypothetical protein
VELSRVEWERYWMPPAREIRRKVMGNWKPMRPYYVNHQTKITICDALAGIVKISGVDVVRETVARVDVILAKIEKQERANQEGTRTLGKLEVAVVKAVSGQD